MKSITMALAIATLVPGIVLAAGPANPADRYDYNMRTTNKDGYVPDPARVSNKDGYQADPARAGDKFDPYTQGARQSTSSALTDTKSTPKKAKPQKKAPAEAAK